MDTSRDDSSADKTLAGGSGQPDSSANVSRRKFSRSALAGGIVIASLGNRSAWGQTVSGCMSVTTIASFNPATGMFVSAPGGRPEHDEVLAAEIHHIAGPDNPTYLASGLGSDGITVYSTCVDPIDADGVCIIEGPDCP